MVLRLPISARVTCPKQPKLDCNCRKMFRSNLWTLPPASHGIYQEISKRGCRSTAIKVLVNRVLRACKPFLSYRKNRKILTLCLHCPQYSLVVPNKNPASTFQDQYSLVVMHYLSRKLESHLGRSCSGSFQKNSRQTIIKYDVELNKRILSLRLSFKKR